MILEPKGKSVLFIKLDFLIGTHFFKTFSKKIFFLSSLRGVKKHFFPLDKSESLIFFMYLPHPIIRFMLNDTEKKGLGG